MIQNIFLPEKIGSYYIFGKRIAGVDIGFAQVTATIIYVSGNKRIIEAYYSEKLDTNTESSHAERTVDALKRLFKQIKKYDSVTTALSSSTAIFKELKLPFTSYEKIKMVIQFEVEPLLPFSLADASIDFIITTINTDEDSAHVLVAAIQHNHIAQHMALFEQAGIHPDRVTIDMFSLYGLYTHIPTYADNKTRTLIYLGIQHTHIAHIDAGQLRFLRTIPKGTSHLAKEVAEKQNISANEAMDHIVRFGLEASDSPSLEDALKNALTSFWQTISFTLTSFTSGNKQNNNVSTLVLLGPSSDIKELIPFVKNQIQMPCEYFAIEDLQKHTSISLKKMPRIPHTHILSTAHALPSEIAEHINMRIDDNHKKENYLLFKQCLVASTLLLILFGFLVGHLVLETHKLSSEAYASEQEAIEMLKDQFKNLDPDTISLDEAVDESEDLLKREEDTWFAFSKQARASFLKYLLELTNRIDKEALDFKVDEIGITEGVMIIKAHVRDHDALKILERSLRQSELFGNIEPQNETDFTMRITLARQREEA